MQSEDGKSLEEQLFLAMRFATELRELIVKRGGIPECGVPENQFPPPPFPSESFEHACRRIFGDYVYCNVMHDMKMQGASGS